MIRQPETTDPAAVAMDHRVAIALCAHHKPWLVMATWITSLAQNWQGADFYVIYNVGDGRCPDRSSYDEYRRLAGVHGQAPPDPAVERKSVQRYEQQARAAGINGKLSPFDERVRAVCRVRRSNVYELEFENDHALDSGAWFKFIQTGIWRQYDFVFFVQEGTLLTRPGVVSAALQVATTRGVQFLAGANYKSCLPKNMFLSYNTRGPAPLPIDIFHDRMILATFDVFCRDPEFRALFDGWSSDLPSTQQNHVPDIWRHDRDSRWGRLRAAATPGTPLPRHRLKRALVAQLQRRPGLVSRLDARIAQGGILYRDLVPAFSSPNDARAGDVIHVDTVKRQVHQVVQSVEVEGVRFHREAGPEWHGCHCNHMFSRAFVERLSERLQRWDMYDVLDLPFAGTALEVIWGFFPSWLGVEKWFFDGFHRVMKDFVSYQREDNPETMAAYVNRYFPDLLYVEAEGDYLKIRHMAGRLRPMKHMLNEWYF